MTSAPKTLLDVRALLQQHTGLPANALGITGDPAHKGGYHCGSDRVVTRDYSVIESGRDSGGLTLDACALDVGAFTVKVGGKTYTLDHFNAWIVGECKAGAADTKDIREVIYRTNSTTVKRWDRLGKRTSGDSSHLWHTHISYHRDAIKAGRDLTPLYRRYLTTIGAIKAATTEDDDMPTAKEVADAVWATTLARPDGTGDLSAGTWLRYADHRRNSVRDAVTASEARIRAGQEAILAAVGGADTAAILARLDAIAAEERQHREQLAAAQAQRDAALRELLTQATSGQRDAREVVDEIARRLGS